MLHLSRVQHLAELINQAERGAGPLDRIAEDVFGLAVHFCPFVSDSRFNDPDTLEFLLKAEVDSVVSRGGKRATAAQPWPFRGSGSSDCRRGPAAESGSFACELCKQLQTIAMQHNGSMPTDRRPESLAPAAGAGDMRA
jgi:hypothetical protein